METDLITQGVKLFAAQKYTEAVKKLKEALDVTDDPQQQSNTQYWLGRCYLEQVLQIGNTALFDTAREHFQKRLVCASNL